MRGLRVRLNANQITDLDLDHLYAELDGMRAALVTMHERAQEARDERDRARGVAVALEQELAQVVTVIRSEEFSSALLEDSHDVAHP